MIEKEKEKKGKMKKKRNKSSPPLPLPSPSDKTQPSSTSSSSSFSFSSSSFSSTPSTFASPSPSPSPYHFSSSIPFSWERKPGVPFTPLHPLFPPPRSSRPLPLPPSKVKPLDVNLVTIRRRRKGFEFFLALIGRLAGLDPYFSCKSVAAVDVANREAKTKTTNWASRRRHRR